MLVMVGFVSQKGGVGKSTLSRALATAVAASKGNVKIADLDPQQHTLTRWKKRREENDAGPTIVVESYKSAADAIDHASLDNQLLIIDAPPRASKCTLEIARRADLVVQPTGPGVDDLDPAILLFHELTRAGIPRENLVMAICRVGSEAEEELARRYVERAGYAVLSGSISEKIAYRDAQNRDQALTETKQKSLNERSDILMSGLLGLITDRVKARVRASRNKGRKVGARG